MTRAWWMVGLSLVVLVGGAAPAVAEEPGWIGVHLAGKGGLDKDEDCPEGVGLEVRFVWGESPGWRGGLRGGDVVVRLDGEPFVGKPGDQLAAFKARLADKPAGTVVALVVRRTLPELTVAAGDGEARPAKGPGEPDPPVEDPRAWLAEQPVGTALVLRGARVRRRLELRVTLGTRPGMAADATVPDNAALRATGRWPLAEGPPPIAPSLAARAPERLGALLTGRAGSASDTADLLRRLRAIEAGDDGFRLDVVRYLHRAPYELPARAEQVTQAMLDPARARWAAFRLLGQPAPRETAEGGGAGTTPAALLDWIEGRLREAAACVDAAFARLSAEERAALPAQLDAIADALGDGIYLFNDVEDDPARRRQTLAALAAARKVDLAALERGLLALAPLLDPEAVRARVDAVAWGDEAGKPVLARRMTPLGLILVGGPGRNVYRDEDAAVIIDVGGDDVYHNNAAGTVPLAVEPAKPGGAGKPAIPVAVVVDLGGDDAYESHRRYAQGCGVCGIGALVDAAGDDSYVGTELTQAVGWFGVGLIDDRGGDDRYRGGSLHQGVGMVGVGLLIDRGGRDGYDARLYSQGLGLPRGVGVVLDLGGDDSYYAKGRRPTGYGTAGVFDAWSQGCGLGFRLDASGGVGLLLDGGGRDRYEGGNFAQGGGYYYGLGVLRDAGQASDVYIGSRYAQGWSAHQALGALIEDGGDDRYLTRHGVNAGLAWDQGVSSLVDKGGDDRYQAAFFSLGASAHNAICLFFDLGGDDRYEGAPVGRSGGNTYHGGTSLSVFVDAGGGRDVYGRPGKPAERRADGALRASKEHTVFADLPGSVADLLQLARGLEALQPPPRKRPDDE